MLHTAMKPQSDQFVQGRTWFILSRSYRNSLLLLLIGIVAGFGCEPAPGERVGKEMEYVQASRPAALNSTELPRPIDWTVEASIALPSFPISDEPALNLQASFGADGLMQSWNTITIRDYSGILHSYPAGPVRAVSAGGMVEDVGPVFFSEDSLWVWNGEEFTHSPLEVHFEDRTPNAILKAGTRTWFALPDTLFVLDGTQLTTLLVPGVSEGIQGLAEIACGNDLDGVWYWSASDVWCVEQKEGDFLVHHHWNGSPEQVVSNDSNVYILDDGRVWTFTSAGLWIQNRLPTRFEELYAHKNHRHIWARFGEKVAHLEEGRMAWCDGLTDATHFFMSASGSLSGMQEGVWKEWTAGFAFNVEGLLPGESVYDDRQVSAVAENPPPGMNWAFLVDDEVLPSNGENVLLDADQLGVGVHELRIQARLDGNVIGEKTIPFTIGEIPTWANTIQPIYEKSCAACHDPNVTTFPLHTAELWEYYYEEILLTLETDIMPLGNLGPLSEDEKEDVSLWGDYGFLP